MFGILQHLSIPDLDYLARSLREGVLAIGSSRHLAQQVGGCRAEELEAFLANLRANGMSGPQIALVVEAVSQTRRSQTEPSLLLDLVLSGPELQGVPTSDTAAVMHALLQEATDQILLVGYAIYNGKRLFEPLAKRMELYPALRTVFCVDIPRKYMDQTPSLLIVQRFAAEFREKHWPWPKIPEVYYDPRSLEQVPELHASLHAKCVVVDRRLAFVTSANFTEAAQHKNIEAGLLVRHAPIAERVAIYFEGLIQSRRLFRCELDSATPANAVAREASRPH